jgi:hypothetical protein
MNIRMVNIYRLAGTLTNSVLSSWCTYVREGYDRC